MRYAGEAVHEADGPSDGPGKVHGVGLESRVGIQGVDLSWADLTCFRLVGSTLRLWQPDHPYDLIT
jgi:hypothetical protein